MMGRVKTARPTSPLVMAGIIILSTACSSSAPPPAVPTESEATVLHTGCRRGRLPDSTCTPGAVMTTDLATICVMSTRGRRRVSSAVRRQVLLEYGYESTPPRGAVEVDHLIPLELGGDNAVTNLWVEPAEPHPGFHRPIVLPGVRVATAKQTIRSLSFSTARGGAVSVNVTIQDIRTSTKNSRA